MPRRAGRKVNPTPGARRWRPRGNRRPSRTLLVIGLRRGGWVLMPAVLAGAVAAAPQPHSVLTTKRAAPASARAVTALGGPGPLPPVGTGPVASDDRDDELRASRASNRATISAPPPAAVPPPAPAWMRPDDGPISSSYGVRWGQLHAGVDLAGPYGSSILAAGDGIVTSAGPAAGYGNLITIAHPDGTVTAYGHMSQILVAAGPVQAGQPIALEGRKVTPPARTCTSKCGSVTPPWTRSPGWLPTAYRCDSRSIRPAASSRRYSFSTGA